MKRTIYLRLSFLLFFCFLFTACSIVSGINMWGSKLEDSDFLFGDSVTSIEQVPEEAWVEDEIEGSSFFYYKINTVYAYYYNTEYDSVSWGTSGSTYSHSVFFDDASEGSGEYTADIVVGADEKDDGYNYPLIYNHGVNLRIVNKNESKGTFRICSVLGTNAYNSLEKTTGGKYKTITFKPNGGEITTDLQYVCESKSVYLKYAYGLGLKRDGYNFKGWSTQPDEDTIAYKDGTLIEVEEDITLYAIWELQ